MKRDYEIGDLIEESREYPLLIRGLVQKKLYGF